MVKRVVRTVAFSSICSTLLVCLSWLQTEVYYRSPSLSATRTKRIRSQEKEMSCQDRLSQWETEVSTAFAHLSKPQIWGLVLWSAGIALSGVAGITQISALLALVLCQGEQSVFQRLREWYLDADQKSGSKRRELDVTTCFAPLLGWALRLWKSETKQLALVIDATTLGKRWTILTISVVVRSCAIPV